MLALERRVQRLTFALKLLEIGAREERIQAAAAEVRQAEAELAKAEWRLGNCTIRAPITGTILKKNAEEGNIVNAVAFNVSFSICDMADLSDMEVELTVQERDIARLFAGQPCRIRPDAFPERVYAGRVSRIMPIADRERSDPGAREDRNSAGRRGGLSQTGDGGRRGVLEGTCRSRLAV